MAHFPQSISFSSVFARPRRLALLTVLSQEQGDLFRGPLVANRGGRQRAFGIHTHV